MNRDMDTENKEEVSETETVAEAEIVEETQVEDKEVMILESELEKLKEEAADAKNKYWLCLADLENTRKRLQKEKFEQTAFAAGDAIVDFLPILDQFEMALGCADQMSDEIKNWAIGFNMFLTQFRDIISGRGIEMYRAEVGGTFDPHLHEALEAIESEEEAPGTILKVSAPGYKMGKRVLRAAQVKVSKAPPKEEKVVESTEEIQDESSSTQGE